MGLCLDVGRQPMVQSLRGLIMTGMVGMGEYCSCVTVIQKMGVIGCAWRERTANIGDRPSGGAAGPLRSSRIISFRAAVQDCLMEFAGRRGVKWPRTRHCRRLIGCSGELARFLDTVLGSARDCGRHVYLLPRPLLDVVPQTLRSNIVLRTLVCKQCRHPCLLEGVSVPRTRNTSSERVLRSMVVRPRVLCACVHVDLASGCVASVESSKEMAGSSSRLGNDTDSRCVTEMTDRPELPDRPEHRATDHTTGRTTVYDSQKLEATNNACLTRRPHCTAWPDRMIHTWPPADLPGHT